MTTYRKGAPFNKVPRTVILEVFNVTASSSTIDQLSNLGEISVLEVFNVTASSSTIDQLSNLGEISVLEVLM